MSVRDILLVFLAGCFLVTICCQPQSGARSVVKGDSAYVVSENSGNGVLTNIEKRKALVTLQYFFRTGDVFGYTICCIEKVKKSRETNADSSTQKVVYRYKFETLESLPDGGGRLRATCMGVEFEGRYTDVSGTRELRFDTDQRNDRDKQKVFAQYNAPVNTPFEIVVDHNGTVSSIHKLDDVIQRYMGDDYYSTKAEQRKTVERSYGETALKKIIQLAFQKLVNKPLGIASSWSNFMPDNIGFLKVENMENHTLKGVRQSRSGKLAQIAVRMKSDYVGPMKLDTDQGWASVKGFKVEGKGTSVFNINKMRVESRTLKQIIFTKLFIEPPDDLKKVDPSKAKNFWTTQEASVENTIQELHL